MTGDGDHAPTMILVTHHIEEIGPWIDHVLVLKGGRTLTDAFDCPCRVTCQGGRYALSLDGAFSRGDAT